MMTDGGKVKEVPFAEHARTRQEVLAEIAAVNWLLIHFAAELPPESPTAKAIARGGSWQEITALARWEGADEILALLEDAGWLGGEVSPEVPHVLDRSMEGSRLKANPIPLPGPGKPPPAGTGENENPSGD